MSFAEACRELRVPMKARTGKLPTPPKGASPRAFEPKVCTVPCDAWRARAAKTVAKAHERLLRAPTPMKWLADRGLDEAAVRKYRLGYLEGEKGKLGIVRPYSVWGMEPREKKDSKGATYMASNFFIPRGIVIPAYAEGMDADPTRLRIRRSDADKEVFGDKYMVVQGSGMAPMLLGAERRAFVVVEAELDAMLVHHLVGDKAGALAVLTNRGKPDAAAHQILSRALTTLVALDYDQAGAEGWTWWRDNCPTARRWPTPVGKDPGDMFKAGEDVRVWIMAGLPQVLRQDRPEMPAPQGPVNPPEPAPATSAAPQPAPLGSSPADEPAPQKGGERPPQRRQDVPQPSAPAVAFTPDLRRALAALARWMDKHAVTFGLSTRGYRAWLFPAHLTNTEGEELFSDLLRLTPDDISALVKAHPADMVTAENLMEVAQR